jgi:hypothetical protein
MYGRLRVTSASKLSQFNLEEIAFTAGATFFSSNSANVERHSVERHSVERHSVERHSVERHSVERHSVERHSVERHCVEVLIVNTKM